MKKSNRQKEENTNLPSSEPITGATHPIRKDGITCVNSTAGIAHEIQNQAKLRQ